MATRLVEGKKPYTGGKAISIDENKVISLNLRDENNLIIYDEGDDEIYVDLQLPDGIEPTDAFPVGVTTGRTVVADGWDKAGTIICAKTTSGDEIKVLYADDGTLWIDNGTGTFKQIYFKADVDLLISTLTTYINTELAKKQNGVTSDTAPSNSNEGDLWYDTANNAMKVWNGTAWQSVGGSDIEYKTQAEYNALLPGALTDNKHYFIYSQNGPTPPSPGRQPGVNTLIYYNFENDTATVVNNLGTLGARLDATPSGITYQTLNSGKKVAEYSSANGGIVSNTTINMPTSFTVSFWIKTTYSGRKGVFGFYSAYDNGFWFNADGYNLNLYSIKDDSSWAFAGHDSTDISDGDWHNVCWTWDGTVNKAYVDKNELTLSFTQGNANGNPVHNNSYIYVGQNFVQGESWSYQGQCGCYILENKARTAQEIQDYFDQTKGDYGIS